MNEGDDSKFERVLNRWDIIVLALGAMIGWGWVVEYGSSDNPEQFEYLRGHYPLRREH